MAINSQISMTSHRGELPRGTTAAAILDELDAALLVVDDSGHIQYRNAAAAAWLPDGPDLESALAEARLLGSGGDVPE